MESVLAIKESHRPAGVPYRLACREEQPDDSVVWVRDVPVGGDELAVMGGPCAVESREQVVRTAVAVKQAGGRILRGGAFKPRTSPYEFRGLGEAGLEILAEAREVSGLPVVTEVLSERDVDLVARYADLLQIGSRNMSNFSLLEAVADTGKPVLLKRGFQATVKEWLLSAEYMLARGNSNIILCERGIRSFDTDFTRNTLDISAVIIAKAEVHLPVIVDPSHATGRADMVNPIARVAVAAGADGLLVEVHPDPHAALCDGRQSLSLDGFRSLMVDLAPHAALAGKTIKQVI